jgi:hypothetical protein
MSEEKEKDESNLRKVPQLLCGAFIFYFSSGLNHTATPPTHRHTLLFVICEQLLQDYFFRYFDNSTLVITMIDDYLDIDCGLPFTCHLFDQL